MKIKELIEVLNEQDPELTVALVCDHGQTTMKLTNAGEGKVVDIEEYMMEEVHPDDWGDGENLTTVFVLEAF